MGNGRIWMHVVGAIAAAISGGTVVFSGLGDSAMHDIVAVASLIGIAVNTYLAGTTSGITDGLLMKGK